jgi:hypothetical protein
LPNLRRIVDMLDKGLGLFKKAIQPFEEVVKRARESKKSRERKNTLRENKLSRKLSELVSENLGVFGVLGLRVFYHSFVFSPFELVKDLSTVAPWT